MRIRIYILIPFLEDPSHIDSACGGPSTYLFLLWRILIRSGASVEEGEEGRRRILHTRNQHVEDPPQKESIRKSSTPSHNNANGGS